MQIKTIIRYHLIPVRMAINKSTNKHWGGYTKKGTLMHCWWDCKLVQPLGKTAWKLKILKMEWPYNPAILLLGIYPMKTKTLF